MNLVSSMNSMNSGNTVIIFLVAFTFMFVFILLIFLFYMKTSIPSREQYVSVPFATTSLQKSNEDNIIDGRCKCCKCGWLPCSECTKQIKNCCDNSFAYTRYSFDIKE